MKIKRVEITSFGKFKNFSMDFSDGFNLIYGKNEDGKSTVMAFISLMLYGTAGSSSRTDISGNFRKKYAPWSGEKMSGDMEIECGGREYLIHKEFRATAKTDKVTVTDMGTGDAVNLPPDTEIGKYFLGIDYNAFEKSVFGATADSFAGSESGDIASRLSNLTDSGDETVSTKNVLARIEGAMDELVKKRSKGKINLVQDRIEELTEYIRNVNIQTEQRGKLSEEYCKTEAELNALNENAKMARLAREGEAKKRMAESYRKLSALSDKVTEMKRRITEKVGTEDVEGILKRCEDYKNAFSVAKDVLAKTEKAEMTNVVSEDDMKRYFVLSEDKRAAAENVNNAERKSKSFRLMAVFGGVISAMGVAAGFLNSFMFLLIPIGIVLLICGLIKSKAGLEREELKKAEQTLNSLFESRGCHSAEEFELAYREGIAVAEKAKIYSGAEKSLAVAESEFIRYVSAYMSVSTYDEAESFVNTLRELHRNFVKSCQDMETFASVCNIEERGSEKLLNLAQDIEKDLPDKAVVFEDAEKIEMEIRTKNARLLEIKGMLGAEPDDIAPAIREVDELNEKLGEMQAYYNDLALARDVILEAEDEMRRSFAPALKERASEILSRLTNGKYKSLNTDKVYEIEVKAEETGGYRSRHYLSRGTLGQSYLALRIALCEMLSDGENVPLLLDDVLADYDDERADLASEFLKEYARDGKQVLFFTCHGRMGEIGGKHNMLG